MWSIHKYSLYLLQIFTSNDKLNLIKKKSFKNSYELKISRLIESNLITEVFPGARKLERKEKPLKKSCQNPVEYAR